MDENQIDKIGKQIIALFDQKGIEDYWMTLDEISRETGIATSDIMKVINLTKNFVRSSYRLRAGEPLFTTRKSFRDKAPFVDKIIGAFKNRID